VPLTLRFEKNSESNVADLRDVMTVPPMSMEQHAAIMRSKVETRRKIEDALEAAQQRRGSLGDL
jgi:hypothetical protein